MKVFITFLLTLFIASLSTQTFSQQLIPFQARLTDGAGAPVADGVYSINFAIYDVATGGAPVNGWVESHAAVSVMLGVVNIFLGSITPLNDPDNDGDLSDAVTFYTTDGNRFIGVTIGTGQEMVPRHQLVPSFHANDASKLGGNLPSYYTSLTQHNADLLAINNQFTGAIIAFAGSCPTGWLLADGTSGTPNLRDRFLRGESTGNPVSLDFGGNDDAIVVAHNHNIDPPTTSLSINTDGSHNHVGGHKDARSGDYGYAASGLFERNDGYVGGAGYRQLTSTAGNHSHSGSVNIPAFTSASTGSSATNANIPRYYEVIYCVKQ